MNFRFFIFIFIFLNIINIPLFASTENYLLFNGQSNNLSSISQTKIRQKQESYSVQIAQKLGYTKATIYRNTRKLLKINAIEKVGEEQ